MNKIVFVLMICLIARSELLANTGGKARMDFDGDGKTDLTLLRADLDQNLKAQYYWHILRSRDGYIIVPWGALDHNPGGFFDGLTPADYDGDGRTDIAIYRIPQTAGQQGYFYILYSATSTYSVIPWGLSSTSNTVEGANSADFDGDGRADIYAVRKNTQTGVIQWWILQSRDGLRFEIFGAPQSEASVCGDYDGDGKADLAVVQSFGMPNNNYNFTFKYSSNGTITTLELGNPTNDVQHPGDYDGDGKTEMAVVSEIGDFPTHRWRYYRSSDGQFVNIKYGTLSDFAAPGDYDGDGKDDIAIYRQTGSLIDYSYFWINGSSTGNQVIQFGGSQNGAVGGSYLW